MKKTTTKLKLLLPLVLLFVHALSLFAQEETEEDFLLGARFGLHFHSISGANTSSSIGTVFGAWGSNKINNLLAWQLELLYVEQGGERSIEWFGFDITTEFNIDYIAVPLLLNVSPVKFMDVHVGIQPGFTIKKETVSSDVFNGSQSSDLEDIKSFDLFWILGAHVKLPYWNGNFGISADYRRGLTNIYNGEEDLSIKNRGFAISATYKIPLSDLMGI